MIIATSTNNGNIAVYQITSLIVHGLYQVVFVNVIAYYFLKGSIRI